MRTTEGPKRVDVIYRRIDDDFLDPLSSGRIRRSACRADVGLQAGNVTLANAVGTGIADDKAVYSYMPEIMKFYLGEEPILKNVPTWRCREPEHLSYVLDNLTELVVKEVHGSGGYGMLIGPKADKRDDRGLPRKLKRDPRGFIAQPTLALSTCRPASRKASRRAMSTCGPSCSPAATASASCRAGSRASRSRRLAGGQFQPGRRHQGHLGAGRMRCTHTPARLPSPRDALPHRRQTCYWHRRQPVLARATSSAPNISRASSKRRSASPRCRSPMAARPTNGNPRSRPPAAPRLLLGA
jgi:hypothetical protein